MLAPMVPRPEAMGMDSVTGGGSVNRLILSKRRDLSGVGVVAALVLVLRFLVSFWGTQ
jgi:hypothetical protein